MLEASKALKLFTEAVKWKRPIAENSVSTGRCDISAFCPPLDEKVDPVIPPYGGDGVQRKIGF